MAFYQVLYWQDIPSQVKVWDDFDEVKIEMSPRFMVKIDSAAKTQGLIDEDSYLSQWRWGEETERPGTPKEVAEIVKNELEAKFI
jgi:hypothetical protein